VEISGYDWLRIHRPLTHKTSETEGLVYEIMYATGLPKGRPESRLRSTVLKSLKPGCQPIDYNVE
jgi:hypothetical protein